MKAPTPRPDYSNAGTRRDARVYESRKPAERAKLADVALTAAEADVAYVVSKVSPRSVLDDAALVAFITDADRIQPVTLADLLAHIRSDLESRYVLTPIP